MRDALEAHRYEMEMGDGVEPVRLLAEIKHLTDRALRMDFAGIRAGLKSLVPAFSQHVDELMELLFG